MGRDHPTVTVIPNANRRQERARRAKETVHRIVPDVLRSCPRARHGIHKAEIIVDPDTNTPRGSSTALANVGIYDGPRIKVQCTDTLKAAAKLSEKPFTSKRTAPTLKTTREGQKNNVAILNMASPVRPGGGFLDGANSQEEFICARSTLYPSLWDSFYRLPEIGGVWTPDVLVFRDSSPDAIELTKRDRFFVDVISAGMFRFPDNNRIRASDDKLDSACTCGVSYCDRDRELVTRKMKSVLRMAQSKGAEKLILGAWGCGAYGNPVKEVAKLWRKVIAGSPRQKRPNSERWEGIQEIIFAIPDRSMLREFQQAFEGVLATDLPTPPLEQASTLEKDASAAGTAEIAPASIDPEKDFAELVDKIQETELQLEQMTNPRSRARIRDILASLNRELAQGMAAKQAIADEDFTQSGDEQADADLSSENDLVLVASHEGNSIYNFDEHDLPSSSTDSGCETSELYDFRLHHHHRPTSSTTTGMMPSTTAPALDDHLPSHSEPDLDDDDEDHDLIDGAYTAILHPSPRFDAKTGWFSGSIDEFHGFLKGTNGPRQRSRASPVLRPEDSAGLSGQQGIDELVLEDYLGRYGDVGGGGGGRRGGNGEGV
ncbi:hypothetical protein D0861_04373 [Hortaea werneckii]|uniref:Microbial-type PARG catalytic domain-containing protein n=1 Tax=Hortaea werneckii TaxID=91943 RepID=A0A3M7FKD9_HORWE|nr:hypothetical protein KC361_g1153 [Hortaea werneckii]KAI6877432.1 hypothetical protein KC325_g9185 [Hortaea werneckii]KAI6999920.1 hypothetical protein KC359_g1545 [Hortaea werneckii]KAI7139711.1 hypothetical protein KC344_g9171 [Hortaea werneckii]KAI7514358.1 hypothetical protein KC347_g720 [Hortaea werneckii]